MYAYASTINVTGIQGFFFFFYQPQFEYRKHACIYRQVSSNFLKRPPRPRRDCESKRSSRTMNSRLDHRWLINIPPKLWKLSVQENTRNPRSRRIKSIPIPNTFSFFKNSTNRQIFSDILVNNFSERDRNNEYTRIVQIFQCSLAINRKKKKTTHHFTQRWQFKRGQL